MSAREAVAVGNGGVALAAGARPVLVPCDVSTSAGDRIDRPAGHRVDLSGSV
jgi:hypothetical protein